MGAGEHSDKAHTGTRCAGCKDSYNGTVSSPEALKLFLPEAWKKWRVFRALLWGGPEGTPFQNSVSPTFTQTRVALTILIVRQRHEDYFFKNSAIKTKPLKIIDKAKPQLLQI